MEALPPGKYAGQVCPEPLHFCANKKQKIVHGKWSWELFDNRLEAAVGRHLGIQLQPELVPLLDSAAAQASSIRPRASCWNLAWYKVTYDELKLVTFNDYVCSEIHSDLYR